eukprot:252115-Rhodomonas_salina.1
MQKLQAAGLEERLCEAQDWFLFRLGSAYVFFRRPFAPERDYFDPSHRVFSHLLAPPVRKPIQPPLKRHGAFLEQFKDLREEEGNHVTVC